MAKAKKRAQLILMIASKDDADQTLKLMGEFRARIEAIELREEETIRQAKERMVDNTARYRELLADYETELEKWAKEHPEFFPASSKTLILNFGKLWFRKSPPKIRLMTKVATVLNRLRAKGLVHCIRTKEEVDKEALNAYDNDVLQELGCKRVQTDEFHYEIKREEVR